MSEDDAARGSSVPIDDVEASHIAGRVRLRAAIIYEIVRAEGVRELARPSASLFWSGFAAGVSIAFSLVAEGVLHAYLPDAPWRHLVASFGYTFGFLIVVLGRQQLFTENTLTAVLPVMARPRAGELRSMLRLWGIVLASNLAGTVVIGALFAHAPLLEPMVHEGMVEVARHFFELDAADMFWRGIVAGWLIATMVWLLPAAESAAIWVVLLITWLIALAGLSHIIAGAVEASFLVFLGEIDVATASFAFFLPTLAGNIVGGSALFALVSYAQVRREMTGANGQ
ncbi:MAG: formate/nitrite transporter family protein [Alphaproteobacteria bacterium]